MNHASAVPSVDAAANRARPYVALALTLWLGAAALLSAGSAFADDGALFTMAVTANIAATLAAYATLPSFRAWFASLGLRTLTLFHVWRVSAALAFFWYGSNDLLPAVFVFNAGWGDFVSGVLLGAVALFAVRRWSFWAAHAIGMADFVIAVGTGILLTGTGEQGIAALRAFPLALVPLVMVPLSALTHVAAFDLLRKGARP